MILVQMRAAVALLSPLPAPQGCLRTEPELVRIAPANQATCSSAPSEGPC